MIKKNALVDKRGTNAVPQIINNAKLNPFFETCKLFLRFFPFFCKNYQNFVKIVTFATNIVISGANIVISAANFYFLQQIS